MKPKLALRREGRLKWESRSYLSFHGARVAVITSPFDAACQHARGGYEKSVASTQSQINYKYVSIATVNARSIIATYRWLIRGT